MPPSGLDFECSGSLSDGFFSLSKLTGCLMPFRSRLGTMPEHAAALQSTPPTSLVWPRMSSRSNSAIPANAVRIMRPEGDIVSAQDSGSD